MRANPLSMQDVRNRTYTRGDFFSFACPSRGIRPRDPDGDLMARGYILYDARRDKCARRKEKNRRDIAEV